MKGIPYFRLMINVSCAVIINSQGLVLATQRSAVMSLPLKWEFPGGKIEAGETAEQALVREIKEELAISIEVVRPLNPTVNGKIHLIPFLCRIVFGEITLKEHTASQWLPPDKLSDLDWAAADIPIMTEVQKIGAALSGYSCS